MKTYKYTDSTNQVVHIIDEDGISRSSCLASTLEVDTTILPADAKSSNELLEGIRTEAQNIIYSVYPAWFQMNCANGIYPPSITDKMKVNITAVITESNRCEDLIMQGQSFTPNWPVIGV